MSTLLNAAEFPLWGSRLIEASAGTGKTWTIAALYLRLVLGHGGEQAHARALRPSEILVMTFTRAATRELSDRIRARLLEAARCFRGEAEPQAGDALLAGLLAAYPEGAARAGAAWRLAMAAESMDDAAVHTIDAWCQRMLREHAFDSGSLFEEELVADETVLLTEAVQDYWRQHCYPLAGAALDTVLSVWSGVEALLGDVKALVDKPLPEGAGTGTLGECLHAAQVQRETALRALAAGWPARAQAMRDWLDAQTAPKTCDWNRVKLKPDNYRKWLQALADWAADPVAVPLVLTEAAVNRLSPDGLLEARKDGAPAIELPGHFEAFAALVRDHAALPRPALAIRLHAAARVAERMGQLKRQAGTFGFADLLHRLDQALAGPQGARLRERILAQYPVALIDEFQDTSPQQYRIFDQIYRVADNDRASALLLIGDPKQSIYGFRGADIYSYLQARRATDGRHYVLGTNHRSTEALVRSVNRWFSRAEEDWAEGAFLFRQGRDNPLPFEAVQARGRDERLRTAAGPLPALTIEHDLAPRTDGESQRLFASRCAEQIVQWLNDPQAGFEQDGQAFRRLLPKDIAVLVRTGKEAAAVRRELRRRGVASVYLSDRDSVFASDEARDLLHWLRAVASPLDARLARAGLATRTLGLSVDELAWLATSDEAFDARAEQLRSLHAVWQGQGVLTMLRQTLHQLDLPARWLAEPDGERRLTNVLHLAELLQGASAQLDGEQALIRWLAAEIEAPGTGSDEQIVRLESDADLVKVVTVHKSKGLEYPVVCMPFACSVRRASRSFVRHVYLADESGRRELRLDVDDATLAWADRERLREDLRLFYVALTRARHALWLGFAALKEARASACHTWRSAAGYLLGGPEPVAEGQNYGPLLQALAEGHDALRLQAAAEAPACTPLAARETPVALVERPPYAARFDRRWTVGSFSNLVRDLATTGHALLPTQALRPADDELPLAVEPLPAGVPAAAAPEQAPPWHRFLRGAVTGNFLHDQLEWLAGEGFALDGNEPLQERLRRRCERAGRAEEAPDVLQWLGEVARTPLPGLGVCLRDLDRPLPEMEFWLPAGRLPAREVDALCCEHLLDGLARPALPERELHGMLMGFADLVFAHEGRYWVLDYKSNSLGADGAAYHRDALAGAMAAHRYDVQAALYLLALHRLLRARLGEAYRPEAHLGGAIYLFLRGIDGPERGGHVLPAPLALIERLDAMLNEPEVSA